MQALRQMGSGFIVGAVSLLLVIGGISLALAETSAPSVPPTPSPLPTEFIVEFASPLPTALPTDTLIPPSASATPLLLLPTLQQPTLCPPPAGWVPILVGANDTLYSIALRYNTSVEELNTKNCLNFVNPEPGRIMYVPSVPTTQTVTQCLPPAGWVKRHVVQAGENLFRIALSYGITYPQIQAGNCMGSSTAIFVGQVLWVPNVPTRTHTITASPTNTVVPPTSTNTPSNTPDFSTPTSTFIVTSSPVPQGSPSPTPTFTPFTASP
jgi:LysM repeat protein